MSDNDRLDNILDEALNEYRQAEPLAGLESRLLQRLQATQPARTGSWRRWGFAAACIAALVVAVWVGMVRRTPPAVAPAGEVAAQPKETPAKQAPAIHAGSPSAHSQVAAARHAVRSRPASAYAAPKVGSAAMAAVFPVPLPLTDEDRAFVAALNQHPEAVQATAASDDAPVIAKIEIKPLSTTDESSGENQ